MTCLGMEGGLVSYLIPGERQQHLPLGPDHSWKRRRSEWKVSWFQTLLRGRFVHHSFLSTGAGTNQELNVFGE